MSRTLASFKLLPKTKESLGLVATKLRLESNTHALEVAVEMLFNGVFLNKTQRQTITVAELEAEALQRVREMRYPL